MNSINFNRGVLLRNQWPLYTVKWVSLGYKLDGYYLWVVIFRITSSNWLDMSGVLACFLGEFRCFTATLLCRVILCYVWESCVKDYDGHKRIYDKFELFVFCLLQKIFYLICDNYSASKFHSGLLYLIFLWKRKFLRWNSCNKIKRLCFWYYGNTSCPFSKRVCHDLVIFTRTPVHVILHLFCRVYILMP